MKIKALCVVSLFVVVSVFLCSSMVMAAKPQDVIEKSNGFPSGPHFNLNIHGKKDDYICNSTMGGKSVFIPEYTGYDYGDGAEEIIDTIEYISNKKSSLTELVVLDPCSQSFDGNPIQVMVPHEAEGYYVFARILGKPNNGKTKTSSSIILYPNVITAACNEDPAYEGEEYFGDYTSCDGEAALGLIIGENLYVATPETYERFNPESTTGQGKSKATDITRLFTYTGWVVDPTLDTNGDEKITEDDIEEGYEGSLHDWLSEQEGLAWYFDNEWILNVADLVITAQGLVNDGTKLLQIRFYPKATTEFVPQ